MLQSAAMCGAADHADGMAGSLAGGLLCERCVALMLTSAARLMCVAVAGMAANRQMLDVAPTSSRDS
jgi:hypothetical protein